MNPEPESQLRIINVVLSIATLIGPVLFGFILWKLSQIFSTKEMHMENKERVKELEDKVQELEVQMARLRPPSTTK